MKKQTATLSILCTAILTWTLTGCKTSKIECISEPEEESIVIKSPEYQTQLFINNLSGENGYELKKANGRNVEIQNNGTFDFIVVPAETNLTLTFEKSSYTVSYTTNPQNNESNAIISETKNGVEFSFAGTAEFENTEITTTSTITKFTVDCPSLSESTNYIITITPEKFIIEDAGDKTLVFENNFHI